MQELLEYMLKSMVGHPDEVEVEVMEEEDTTIFNVSLNEDDKGLVIGKGGRTIKSIRNVLAVIAMQEGKRVSIKITD